VTKSETAPALTTDAAPKNRAATKPLDRAHSTWRARWARIHARRAASFKLDQLVGVRARPDIAVLYGLHRGDDG
jgi:hypothetical protein